MNQGYSLNTLEKLQNLFSLVVFKPLRSLLVGSLLKKVCCVIGLLSYFMFVLLYMLRIMNLVFHKFSFYDYLIEKNIAPSAFQLLFR